MIGRRHSKPFSNHWQLWWNRSKPDEILHHRPWWKLDAKYSLCIVLIQLEILWLLPIHPVILVHELAAGQFHHVGSIFECVAWVKDVILCLCWMRSSSSMRSTWLLSWSWVNWENSDLDTTCSPWWEMSGMISGCEKKRLHQCELDGERRAKMGLASDMDATGSISFDQPCTPNKCPPPRYFYTRCAWSHGSKENLVIFSMKHNPAVRWVLISNLWRLSSSSNAVSYGSGEA